MQRIPRNYAISLCLLWSLSAQAADPVIATVNSTKLTGVELEAYKRARPDQQTRGDDALLDEIVNMELLAQDAVKQKLDKDPAVAADVENQRKSIMARAVINKLLGQNPITDADLRKTYDERVQNYPRKQFKLKHIVTDTEDQAKQLIGELNGGKAFADAMKDPRVKDTSGDLDWLTKLQIPQEAQPEIEQMLKGTYSQRPIKTQTGWHILLLEDTRDVPVPTFAEAQGQIRAAIENAKVQEYINQLKTKATIKINR